uniref:Uncharacterized protein n=1 Tax=Anguilla anguilla TaxID=7936 RepID=A0A0E9TWE6_ANGAN
MPKDLHTGCLTSVVKIRK